jgi:putative acetyltransferase
MTPITAISTDMPAVRALIAIHLAGMHASSPPESVFALDLSGYARPGLTLWGGWRGAALAGMIALQRLDARHGEIKSMRTHPDHLRRGVAADLLDHLIAVARQEGMTRLSLETGSTNAFQPALALYLSRGFREGEAFGGYAPNPFSRFFHLTPV